MIAIAESGSTKCDWVLLDDNYRPMLRFKTQGFNPYFHSAEVVAKTLDATSDLAPFKKEVTQVYFYGAGCSSPQLCSIIEDGLIRVFTEASVEVDHDLIAAAYALYEGEPLIACIIGTGSNSCFFDGENVDEGLHALGFILGDEAGGCYFGKKLLSDYFYNELPTEIHEAFKKQYDMTWDDAVLKIYGNNRANVFLASFMPFIASFKETEYVRNMIAEGMGRFIDMHVTKFPDYQKYAVGFVGTISHVFEDILKEELEKRNCRFTQVVKSPVDRLIRYHLEYRPQHQS